MPLVAQTRIVGPGRAGRRRGIRSRNHHGGQRRLLTQMTAHLVHGDRFIETNLIPQMQSRPTLPLGETSFDIEKRPDRHSAHGRQKTVDARNARTRRSDSTGSMVSDGQRIGVIFAETEQNDARLRRIDGADQQRARCGRGCRAFGGRIVRAGRTQEGRKQPCKNKKSFPHHRNAIQQVRIDNRPTRPRQRSRHSHRNSRRAVQRRRPCKGRPRPGNSPAHDVQEWLPYS